MFRRVPQRNFVYLQNFYVPPRNFSFTHKSFLFPEETLCPFQTFCVPLKNFAFTFKTFVPPEKLCVCLQTFAFPRETLCLFMKLLCSLKKFCVHLQNFCVPLKTKKSPNLEITCKSFSWRNAIFLLKNASQCRVLGGNVKVLWANTKFLRGMLNFYEQMQKQCNII